MCASCLGPSPHPSIGYRPSVTSSRSRTILAVLLLWTLVALLSSATNLLFSAPMEKPPEVGLTFAFQFASWAPWALITPLVFWLTRRFPLPRYLPLHLFASIAMALTHLAVVAWVGQWLFEETAPQATWVYIFRMWLGSRLIISALTYWLLTGAAFAFNYYQQWRAQELRSRSLEGELAQAELATLRMQLQPHFLFNALHAINVLIKEDPGRAGKVVIDLGDLLRSSLQGGTEQLVRLGDERALIERYLAIESIRFAERLEVRLDFPAELEGAKVPHFILQPLVENAFKHGLSRSTELTHLLISARRVGENLVLEVSNDGPAPPAPPPLGFGLTATRRRLHHLYGERGTLAFGAGADGHGASAVITLPCTA